MLLSDREAVDMMQQEDDGMLMFELQWVQRSAHQLAEVAKDDPLSGLHEVWGKRGLEWFGSLGWAILGPGTQSKVFHRIGTVFRLRSRFNIYWTTVLSWSTLSS